MSKCELQTERKGNYMRDSHKELVIKTAIQEYKNSVLFGFSSSTAHAINMMENTFIMCSGKLGNVDFLINQRKILW